MTSVQQLTTLVEGISCHSWNADKSMLAISPNNNEIHIYETKTWNKLYTLSEHDLLVSGIDWSHVTNKIVSCSHDRNAFVWTFDADANTWRPALVILRIDRAALDVKWSFDGLRFAVTSGSKCVPVCTYEPSNDWWVCKMVKKKFKSTVLCCAFHPTNGQLLATGSADFKCRIYSTYSSDVDGNSVISAPFPSPVEFGEAYVELSALGWVHAVAWSPSGNVIAFASHDSSLQFARLGESAEPVVYTVRLNDLPLTSLLFISEIALVGGGHDMNPALFVNKGSWAFKTYLDKDDAKSSSASEESASAVSKARDLFKNKAARGQDTKADGDVLKTKHERAIFSIQNASSRAGSVTKFSTTSLDGKLVLWDMQSLEADFASLKL